MTSSDNLGNRMKQYERSETGRSLMPLLPTIARMDGVNFSKLTKGMGRPYEESFSSVMIETTKHLVKETNALIGYTQSDEISLLWYSDNTKTQIFNNGKIQKMVSKLAAMTATKFSELCRLDPKLSGFLDKHQTIFDARVWNVPTKWEAANVFLWRERDATKNSISMAASSVYSHKQLMHKNQCERQELLFKKDINWDDYPEFFKRGSFIRREKRLVKLTEEQLNRIPERVRPVGPVERNVIVRVNMPPFSKVENRIGVIFSGEEPVKKEGINERDCNK